MNRTAFFLSLLLTIGLSEYTTPFHGAIAHESSDYLEFSDFHRAINGFD